MPANTSRENPVFHAKSRFLGERLNLAVVEGPRRGNGEVPRGIQRADPHQLRQHEEIVAGLADVQTLNRQNVRAADQNVPGFGERCIAEQSSSPT